MSLLTNPLKLPDGSLLTIGGNIMKFEPEINLGDYLWNLWLESENARRHIITPQVTAQLDTSRSVYGGSSLRTTGDGYIELVEVGGAFDFPSGTEEFTYKGYVSFASGDGTRRILLGQMDAGGTNASMNIIIEVTTGNKLQAYFAYGASTVQLLSTTSILADSSFTHFAFVRDVDTLRLYIDGVEEDTADVTGLSMNTSVANFCIGRGGALNGLYANGYFDLMEFDTGICRYPSGTPFMPPTTPTTVDEYTVLALNFEGSNGSTRILDSAKPSYTIDASDDFSGTDGNAGSFEDRMWNSRWASQIVNAPATTTITSGALLQYDCSNASGTESGIQSIIDVTLDGDFTIIVNDIITNHGSDGVFTDGVQIGLAGGSANNLGKRKQNSVIEFTGRIAGGGTIEVVTASNNFDLKMFRVGSTLTQQYNTGSGWTTIASGTEAGTFTGINLYGYNAHGGASISTSYTYGSIEILDGAGNPIQINTDTGATPILPDFSGNENDAEQSTVAYQPSYNALTSALEFDGSDDFMEWLTMINLAEFNVFAVFEPIRVGRTPQSALIGSDAGSGDRGSITLGEWTSRFPANEYVSMAHSSPAIGSATSAPLVSELQLMTFRLETDNTNRMRINGVDQSLMLKEEGGITTTYGFNRMKFIATGGINTDAPGHFNLKAILITGDLSERDMLRIEKYLQNKYGI